MGPKPVEAAARPHVLQWPAFVELFGKVHKQGEHVGAVGVNGSGKSVLMYELCKIIGGRKVRGGRPAPVSILAVKPRDSTLEALVAEGWPVLKSWPPAFGQEHNIIWPKGRVPSTAARDQRRVFGPLLDTIYQEGGQTVCIDEAAYFERPLPSGLALHGTMEQYWSCARSLKLTLIAGTQRPRNVTRSMWSEPAWLFVFSLHDRDDLKRVAELSSRRDEVLELAPQLGPYEFLCVRRQQNGPRELYVSRVERAPVPVAAGRRRRKQA